MHLVDVALLPDEELDISALLAEDAPPAGDAPGSSAPGTPADGARQAVFALVLIHGARRSCMQQLLPCTQKHSHRRPVREID